MSYLDYEHAELENRIRNLERRIDKLKYEIRRLQEGKVDKYHKHTEHRSEY